MDTTTEAQDGGEETDKDHNCPVIPEVLPAPDVIKFRIGDVVYHRLDGFGSPGLVMGHMSQPGHYKYLVRWDDMEDRMHYDFELTSTPNYRETED